MTDWTNAAALAAEHAETTEAERAVARPVIDALLAEQFGGIRIEETVRVGTGEPHVLSDSLPSEPEEVIALVGGG